MGTGASPLQCRTSESGALVLVSGIPFAFRMTKCMTKADRTEPEPQKGGCFLRGNPSLTLKFQSLYLQTYFTEDALETRLGEKQRPSVKISDSHPREFQPHLYLRTKPAIHFVAPAGEMIHSWRTI